jgi:hypothetical protein
MRARRRTLLLAALMLLASFGALSLEQGFVHTDDGCAVETHCLACRWAYGATSVVAAQVALSAPVAAVELVTARSAAAPAAPAVLAAESRGPPRSS